MATTLSDIKRRIGTTTQIRKVTATLQKVAAAKLAQDLRRISNANTYFNSICRMLSCAHDAMPAEAPPNPLMTPQDGDTIALIVFGSDRGLCGAFNTLLMNAIRDFIKTHSDKRIRILFRGKVAYRRALRHQIPDIEQVEETEAIANRVLEDFENQRVCEVYTLYWDYITGMDQKVVSEQILPTPFTAQKTPPVAGAAHYDAALIEPSPQALLNALLPEYIRCSIHNGFYNSAVTENAQRRTSMARATENASEMLVELKKTYSRLRQENITTEMLEILAGLTR